MHFTGRTWRPPYEAFSVIIQATTGCTYNQCHFCNLYQEEPFCVSPMKEFEEDLEEIKSYQPYARRLFLTGANPFAMSYENLLLRAFTVRDYLIKCQTIAMFASIRDIKSKTVEQLRRLKAAGINGISIGMESADDETLSLANKGYTSKDILEQCGKLDEAGIEYHLIYMTGLAGAGKGVRNAIHSAHIINKLNPYFLGIDSLTLFPDTKLYHLAKEGRFIPAAEKERLEELATLLEHLQIRVHLQANTKSNFLPLSGYLPKETPSLVNTLRETMVTVTEEEMLHYRNHLDSL